MLNKKVGIRDGHIVPPGSIGARTAVVREDHQIFSNGERWRLMAISASGREEILLDAENVCYGMPGSSPRSSTAAIAARQSYWARRLAAFDDC